MQFLLVEVLFVIKIDAHKVEYKKSKIDFYMIFRKTRCKGI